MSLRVSLPTLFAWMLSTVVHAIGLCVAILLAADFSVVPRVAPFRWDVNLVAASQPSPISSDRPTPALASSTREMPITRHVFVQPLPPVMRPTSESPRAVIKQTVPAIDGPMLGNTRLDNPIEASSQGKESTNAFPQSANDFLQEPHPEDPMPAAMMSPITSPAFVDIPPPVVETSDQSNTSMRPSVPETHQVVSLPAPQLRPTPISRQVQPNCGWLASLVTAEVELVKRYPTQAKWHRWQGNVIVQAVIHDDGRISHIQVVDSSGHDTLDHDAVALLERISPVQLQYPLDQSSIVVHIPIGYRLE